jgi:hypothetical protein
MAKTRMLKPDLRTSEKVASWPIEIRYFWVLLWGHVDDHGKAKDNPLLVKADCFPLDAQITGEVIDRWLWGLVSADVIVRYTVDGLELFQIKNWKEHQRPQHPTADNLPSFDNARARIRKLHAPLMHDAGGTLELLIPELSRDELGLGSPAVPSPFCISHPAGTKATCRQCGDARRAYDLTLKQQLATITATPMVTPGTCAHEYPLGECDYCEVAS